jgi:acetyltransferase-like isoleucine patch superfamily enzyme
MIIKKTKIPIKKVITIGILPSFLKKIIYRVKGYKIGKNVSIGFGSVIIGKSVVLQDNVKIGFLSIIRAREIKIERFSIIGSFTMIDTGKLRIGEDSRINEQVIVGGMITPQSALDLGKRTIIMEYSFINTTLPVTIGDDSGIGGHCLLFTHGSWLSQLDGFPVTFAPITLGKKVWLPWRVFIMPGVTIGNEVVIGANSLVSKNLPSNVLAAGSPAQIIKENYPSKITDEKRESILMTIISDFIEFLTYNGIKVSKQENNHKICIEIYKKNQKLTMLLIKEYFKESYENIDLLLINHLGTDYTSNKSKMTIDLKSKTRMGSSDLGEEFIKFISRYGVKFERLD